MLHHATRKIGYQEPAVAYGVYRDIAKASYVIRRGKKRKRKSRVDIGDQRGTSGVDSRALAEKRLGPMQRSVYRANVQV